MNSQIFEGQIIDTEPNGDKEKGDPNEKEEEIGDDDGIWNLKTNTIPRGMVELERMFDNNESEGQRRPPPKKGSDNCVSFNLGTREDPRMVKIGKACTEQESEAMIKLLSEYMDVIT